MSIWRYELGTALFCLLAALLVLGEPCLGQGRRPARAKGVAGPGTQPFELDLFVREDQGIDRVNEPIASGIPLRKGALLDPSHVRVYDASGKPVPCQAHQLGLCWPDGSLRWVLLQFQASVPAKATARYTLKVEPDRPAVVPPERVIVKEVGSEHVEVTTGPIRFTVSRGNFRLPSLLSVRDGAGTEAKYAPLLDRARLELVADREHMTLAEFKASRRQRKDLAFFGMADTGAVKWGRLRRGIDYSDFLTGRVKITVEEDGPMRAVLRIERAAEKREGEIGFVVRIYAYAGKKHVRMELTIESYEQSIDGIVNTKHIRKLAYRIGLPGAAKAVAFGGSSGLVRARAGQSPALQQFDPEAFQVLDAAGKTLAQGDRAPGWMAVKYGGHIIAIATKWFWEIAPKALRYDARERQMVLELRPEAAPGPGYPIPRGRVKTYEFLLGVDVAGPELSAMARAELRAYPDPDYVASTGAAHRFVPLADPRFSKYADYVRESRKNAAAKRLYGDIDFGDQVGWNLNARWNGYHGVTHEWFMFYLASGEPELFRIAEQETWHSIDVDTQHWGFQPGCREAEYARKYDHVCTGHIQGGIKAWVFGEVDYYFLTGRRRVLESIKRTARFLLSSVAGPNYLPQRHTSLPWLHLLYIYEAIGSEEALGRAYRGAMKAGSGKFRIDSIGYKASKPYLDGFKKVSIYFNGVYDRDEHMLSSFMASYPAEAFYRYYVLTGDKRGVDGLVKAARFLYKKLIVPTGMVQYAGGAPWRDMDVWVPHWDGVEAPAALAYMATGNAKFLEWGKAPVDWILNYRGYAYSSALPGRTWGAMGFGGTLPTFLWAMREAGMTQDDLTTQRTDIDMPEALRICRDECMKYYDLAMQNTPESGTFCRLAAEVGRILVNQQRYAEAIEWLEKWHGAPYGFYAGWVLERAKALKAQQPKKDRNPSP